MEWYTQLPKLIDLGKVSNYLKLVGRTTARKGQISAKKLVGD